ncbi:MULTISPECIES: Lrp/AsnC ligand binding domain-containing protein [Halobacterium]|uniref:Transcription regulator n=4 Tax=Halobacterium salinarum TaxID=2242 RepID=Q9HNV9_HALSA|nr:MULTISPECIES: Lrp/AsnC ligand binding domain-containing protein [Halobacterium]AAG20111.1 transcription regulator [Halobacterium salinarum NRC-1]MBB6089124.1 DNA-binding Lrp family transcriptional regulator [Halobacterium salinarum]MCF2166180.1 Lrp/AsnC ligand binding domain-containing protein [Halobacterium salinarum]MCF2167663.1 Lrp/AsnC ligand binding domain-containing protein [Halobacterium salinarum]MCF2207569.1 Lrp/AsnC ligand binding domain-containing protein [Halobacterium salinarum
MVVAYVLVKANTGRAEELLDEIATIDGVVNAHIVAGDVDLIAKVDVDTPADVKEIVTAPIQNRRGVEDTETYISM